jgi:hypothetical protein
MTASGRERPCEIPRRHGVQPRPLQPGFQLRVQRIVARKHVVEIGDRPEG